MPHFFIDQSSISDSVITISDKENYNHIARALHANIGEKLLLIDQNRIQYECVIEKITSKEIAANIEKSYPSTRKQPLDIYLAQSVLKKEAQATAIQKACELGVKGIYPIITDNCVVKKNYVQEKIEKYNKLSYEASKQCERADIAPVFDVREFQSMLEDKSFDLKIACVEKHATSSLKACLKKIENAKQLKILLIIGPEGGFSEAEFELLKQSDVKMVSLGNLILRADTAVVAALADTIYELCDE